jgi:type IV pilus assembly protein PilM
MGLFGSKKPSSFLGVDIGASGIKLVELGKEKGRPKLLTYGYSELPHEGDPISLFEDPRIAGQMLTEVYKKAGCKSTMVMTALPMSEVFSSIISVPRIADKKKLQEIIDAEVAKLTPIPIEEMITYSTFIDEVEKKPEGKKAKKEKGEQKQAPEKESKFLRVLVTGSAKSMVQKYVEIFKHAKLDLQAIDTESFSLIRSLVGKDKSTVCLIDMGSRRTNLTIVESGISFISRSINIGGESVTKSFMEQMQMQYADAERMKRDLGSSANTQANQLPPVLETLMHALVNEIRYVFQLYASTELTSKKKVEKIILTGGSSHLPGLPEYLSHALSLNVYRGDPWARTAYPEELRRILDEIGPRMAVAVGLAMRDIDG